MAVATRYIVWYKAPMFFRMVAYSDRGVLPRHAAKTRCDHEENLGPSRLAAEHPRIFEELLCQRVRPAKRFERMFQRIVMIKARLESLTAIDNRINLQLVAGARSDTAGW